MVVHAKQFLHSKRNVVVQKDVENVSKYEVVDKKKDTNNTRVCYFHSLELKCIYSNYQCYLLAICDLLKMD